MEIWDLYDKNKNVTGKYCIRGDEIPDNYYHLLFLGGKKWLIIKIQNGIDLVESEGKLVYTKIRKNINEKKFNDIMDVWLFEYNGEVELTNATTDEVIAVKWMKKDNIKDYFNNNKLVPTLNYFFEEIEI